MAALLFFFPLLDAKEESLKPELSREPELDEEEEDEDEMNLFCSKPPLSLLYTLWPVLLFHLCLPPSSELDKCLFESMSKKRGLTRQPASPPTQPTKQTLPIQPAANLPSTTHRLPRDPPPPPPLRR
jgi:hypothetical protein